MINHGLRRKSSSHDTFFEEEICPFIFTPFIPSYEQADAPLNGYFRFVMQKTAPLSLYLHKSCVHLLAAPEVFNLRFLPNSVQ